MARAGTTRRTVHTVLGKPVGRHETTKPPIRPVLVVAGRRRPQPRTLARFIRPVRQAAAVVARHVRAILVIGPKLRRRIGKLAKFIRPKGGRRHVRAILVRLVRRIRPPQTLARLFGPVFQAAAVVVRFPRRVRALLARKGPLPRALARFTAVFGKPTTKPPIRPPRVVRFASTDRMQRQRAHPSSLFTKVVRTFDGIVAEVKAFLVGDDIGGPPYMMGE